MFNAYTEEYKLKHNVSYRSVLHKITIGLLYFWDVYDLNLWEKLAIMVKLWLAMICEATF